MRLELLAGLLVVCLGCEQTLVRSGLAFGDEQKSDFPQDSSAGDGDLDIPPGPFDHSEQQPFGDPDTDAQLPAGAELCNGVDDDGDGLVDEEDAKGCTGYYLDTDLDGYGIGSPRCLCQPTGFHTAAENGDCLDDSPYVYPGAEENCYNLVDDDCDGEAQLPDCQGKECGPDGCGGSCGDCAGARNECLDGLCTCSPECAGKKCGSDGCGGSCGTCPGNEECSGGSCVCVPQCGGKECGPNGCGGLCGSCASGWTCESGGCVCQPQCQGKECGNDGCSGNCGSCPAPYQCQNGQCACVPGTGCNPISSGDTITIRSNQWNTYCAAQSSGLHAVHCDKSSAVSWGLYTVQKPGGSGVLHSGDTVSLRCSASNKYCAAENYDDNVVHCDRDSAGPWEQYTLDKAGGSGELHSGAAVTLRSNGWSKYCTAENFDQNVMHCNREAAGIWEQFTIGKP